VKIVHLLILAGTILLLVAISSCNRKPVQEGIHSDKELKQLFADPPSEYWNSPHWDWNEQTSKEGIDFQMKEFKKAGIGGVFVYPRPGLLPEYLSDDLGHLFDYTVGKGKELNMKAWIYDENLYPLTDAIAWQVVEEASGLGGFVKRKLIC
jgi:hypothetical protein